MSPVGHQDHGRLPPHAQAYLPVLNLLHQRCRQVESRADCLKIYKKHLTCQKCSTRLIFINEYFTENIMKKEEKKNKVIAKKQMPVKVRKKFTTWFAAKKTILATYVALAMADLFSIRTFASEETGGSGGAAESKWDAVIGFILPWITRLGGVVILIGAIEFGLAFKSDDAEGKTKGMRTIIAGCIVTAVGASSNIFLA